MLHKPTDIGFAGGLFRIRGRRRRRSRRHRWGGGGPGRSAGRPESPENGDQEQKNAADPVRFHDVAQSYSFSSSAWPTGCPAGTVGCSSSTSTAHSHEPVAAESSKITTRSFRRRSRASLESQAPNPSLGGGSPFLPPSPGGLAVPPVPRPPGSRSVARRPASRQGGRGGAGPGEGGRNPPRGAAGRQRPRRRGTTGSGTSQAAGMGRAGGGSAASPSAASRRRTRGARSPRRGSAVAPVPSTYSV